MFVHPHRLEHLLRPEHYTSADFYRKEVDALFRPAWHPVCVAGDVARPGDFVFLTVLDTPVLVRNCDGEVRAFLNVCPHRHSLLVDAPKGHSPKFKCRYHGWEFQPDGRTAKIPDAQAFRPWDRENACLTRFRVDGCNQVVFVCLSDDAPPLREFLAPVWDVWSAGYGGDYRHAATWEADFPCNWKVVLENSLESYHIPEVHPGTFGDYPPADNAWHELTDRFSSFRTVPPPQFALWAERRIARYLGYEPQNMYWHRVLHPHLTGSSMDSCRMLQCVFPTGPQTCRYRAMFFTLRGSRKGRLAWLGYRVIKAAAMYVGRRVFVEDGSIYEGVQRGLAASPHRGVIGNREERIHAFQRYVLDRTSAVRVPLDVAG